LKAHAKPTSAGFEMDVRRRPGEKNRRSVTRSRAGTRYPSPSSFPSSSSNHRRQSSSRRKDRMQTITTTTVERFVPAVGLGATLQIGSDFHPVTVIHVSKSRRVITIQCDRVQSGLFLNDLDGSTYRATLRDDGRYRIAGWKTGGRVRLGERRHHHDRER